MAGRAGRQAQQRRSSPAASCSWPPSTRTRSTPWTPPRGKTALELHGRRTRRFAARRSSKAACCSARPTAGSTACGPPTAQLAWRFRAAPVDRRMMAYEQLESAWPVSGSVLVTAARRVLRGRPLGVPRRRHAAAAARSGHRQTALRNRDRRPPEPASGKLHAAMKG